MSIIGYRDATGTDLSNRFEPYVSGTKGVPTGYLDLSRNDLNTLC